MKKTVLLTALAVCVAAAPAMARHITVDAQRGSFEAQSAEVRNALADGETYVEMNGAHRHDVGALLDAIQQQLGGRSFSELDPASRARVMESQSRLNALLDQGAKDSRQVCRRERLVGSNRHSTQCMTAAQRARMRDAHREGLRQITRGGGSQAPGN